MMDVLRKILNSVVWTTQDASEARQATTLATPSPGAALDPLAAPSCTIQGVTREYLYALVITQAGIDRVYV